ncbi:MAG: acylphosphatase [bacterium]
MAEQARARLVIRGVVQGVGYRYFARKTAEALGLAGQVRNCPDGAVEVVVEGDRPAVVAFIEETRIGPRYAVVERVDVDWQTPEGDVDGFRYVF